MFADLLPLYPMLVPFLLVLFRVVGLFVFVPMFSNTAVPGNVKILLSLAIALCIWNVVPHASAGGAPVPDSLIGLVIAVGGEMTVGLMIGLLVGAVFAGIQLGAHLVAQQMGLALSAIYDPSFEGQSTVIEQVGFWIALVAFLGMGGHREVINAIVYSYKVVPMGTLGLSPDVMLAAACNALDASFHAAAQVAMPSLVAFFVGTLTIGLMSRSMPQMQLMSMSVSAHLVIGFMMVSVGMAGWAVVSKQSFDDMFVMLGRLLN
jgi:flagellar biosynthetic protein FliR